MTELASLAVDVAVVLMLGLAALACQFAIYWLLRYTRPNIRFHKLKNDRTGGIVFLIRNLDAVRYRNELRVTLEPVAAIARVCVHAGPYCSDPPAPDAAGTRLAIAFTKVPADATFSIQVQPTDRDRSVKIFLDPSSPLRPRRFDVPLPAMAGIRRAGYFAMRFTVGLAGFVAVFCAGARLQGWELQAVDWAFIAAGLAIALAVFALVVPTGGKPLVAGYLGWSGASRDWCPETAVRLLPRPAPPSAVDILVVVALAEEHLPFRQVLELTHHPAPVDRAPQGQRRIDYWTAVVPMASGEPRRIALVVQKGMGAAHAASLTSTAIEQLRPRAVAMSGILGGFQSQEVALGDIVISQPAVDYSGKVVNRPQGASGAAGHRIRPRLSIEKMDARLAERVHAWMTNDQDDRQRSRFLSSIRPELLGVIKVSDRFGAQILCGPVASGPLVVDSLAFVEQLQTIDDKLLGVEMEIHAVMRAGHDAGLPVIGIKGVSDLADGDKSSPRDVDGGAARRFAAHASARLCVQLIRDRVI